MGKKLFRTPWSYKGVEIAKDGSSFRYKQLYKYICTTRRAKAAGTPVHSLMGQSEEDPSNPCPIPSCHVSSFVLQEVEHLADKVYSCMYQLILFV